MAPTALLDTDGESLSGAVVEVPDARRSRAAGRGPTLDALFAVLFAVGGWRVGLRRLSDNSFLWHLRTGRRILEHGIPHHDPYSFSAPGIRWVAQSWLAELLYGALDRVVGPFGIRVAVALCGAALGFVMFRLARRFALDRLRAAGLTLVAFLAVFGIFSERPLGFGLLALVGVVAVVECSDARIARRPIVALAVLFWLWGNVHGSFALGAVYVGLHLVGRALDGARPWEGRDRDLAVGTLIGLAVLVVNPYGFELLTFPVQLVRRGRVLSQVVEWRSPDFRSALGMAFAAWVAVLVVCLARAVRRPNRRDVVVAVPFVLLALWAMRNIGVAVIVTLPIAARAVATDRPRGDDELVSLRRAAAALLTALALLFGVVAAGEPDFSVGQYPVAALRHLNEEHALGRRLLTTDAWAGYVILRWPQQKVFFDDRFDMYPPSLLDDYTAMTDGRPSWHKLLERWRIDVVMLPPKSPLAQLLAQDREWRRDYRDTRAVVYIRH